MLSRCLLVLFVFCFLVSCNQKQSQLDCITLSVDLKQSTLQYEDVFSDAEVIPLETTDSSLVVFPARLIEYEEKFYLYDIHTVNALSFDHCGKFICKFGAKGQGPGEYTWLASISIDKKDNFIHLVEPIGQFHDYTLDGKYIQSRKYPDGKNYQSIYHVDDYMVTWSSPSNSQYDCISIFNSETMELMNSYNKGSALLKMEGFYSYGNKLYYFEKLEGNSIYEVTKDSLTKAYQWDFGKDNFDVYSLNLTFDDDNKKLEYPLFWEYMEDGTIPYIKVSQAQNKDYYYACLRYQYKYDKNVFYRKSDGKYLILGEKNWNVPTSALVFTDDYMIILLNHNNYENFKSFLPDSERRKLNALTEDDNPCLLKLYFKK